MTGRLVGVVALALLLATGASASSRAEEWTVSISAPTTVQAGADFTVTASVTYTYASGNDNITLAVQLPNDAAIKDFSDHTNCNTSGCTFHNLTSTASVTYTLTAPSTAGANLSSFASSFNGFGTPTPPSQVSAITTVTAPPPPITISASAGSNQVAAGGSVGFTVTATNVSSSPVANVWVSTMLGIDWSSGSTSQTGGPGFSCSHPDPFDTNCQIGSFPAGATATFTASATASTTAALGEILNARFYIFLGPTPTGGTAADSELGVQVVAAGNTPTTTAAPPPTTTAPTPAPVTTATTTGTGTTEQTTTTTAAPTPQAARCVVPNFVGRTLADARVAALRHQCRLTIRYASSRKVRKGRVMAQGAAAGRRLPYGSHIRIVVSKGRNNS